MTENHAVYEVASPEVTAEIAKYFDIPELRINPFDRNFSDLYVDGEISFGISTGTFSHAVGSMDRYGEGLTVVQIQAVDRVVVDMFGKGWPFLVLGISEEIARRSGRDVLRVQPAEENLYFPQEGQTAYIFETHGRSLEEVRQGMQLRYNATARRSGYKKDPSGYYVKKVAA